MLLTWRLAERTSGWTADDWPRAAGLRAKSEALREQRRKERLDAYNVKNFGDYFDFVAGAQREGKLTDNDKAIRAWLETNAAAR